MSGMQVDGHMPKLFGCSATSVFGGGMLGSFRWYAYQISFVNLLEC